MVGAAIQPGFDFRHALQRELGRLLAPLWVPWAALYLRSVKRYRIEGVRESRRQFARFRDSGAPILVCANHLTLIDSMLVALALVPAWKLAFSFGSMPWNTPERENFAAGWGMRFVTYLAKCIPISRGGRREEVASVLERLAHLTRKGEMALVFPEGGRSRSGRVDLDAAAWGIGRVIGSVPGCHVVCVYLRGRVQRTWSDFPATGDTFDVEVACIEPKSGSRGARRSRDLARQVVSQLVQMEEQVLDDRQ